MAFTKLVGAGIHTLSNITSHNIHSSGIITATKFDGPFDGSTGDFSGNVTIGGNLTVNGTTTTLDTNLIDVDKIEVTTAGTNVAVAVTHNGTGDLVRLYDGASQKITIDDVGNVGIGSAIPEGNLIIHGGADNPGIKLKEIVAVVMLLPLHGDHNRLILPELIIEMLLHMDFNSTQVALQVQI